MIQLIETILFCPQKKFAETQNIVHGAATLQSRRLYQMCPQGVNRKETGEQLNILRT